MIIYVPCSILSSSSSLTFLWLSFFLLTDFNGDRMCNESFEVRLRQREDNEFAGIVEVCNGTTWGPICAESLNSWTRNHALIVCGQLGIQSESEF